MKVTETKRKSHRQELPGEATEMVLAKKPGTFPGQSQIPSHRGQGAVSSDHPTGRECFRHARPPSSCKGPRRHATENQGVLQTRVTKP